MQLQFTYALVLLWNIVPNVSAQASDSRKLLRTGIKHRPSTITPTTVNDNEEFGQLYDEDLENLFSESARMLMMSMSMSMDTGSNQSSDSPGDGIIDPPIDDTTDPLVDDLFYTEPPDGYYTYPDDPANGSPDTGSGEIITPPTTSVPIPATPTTTPVTPAISPTSTATEPATSIDTETAPPVIDQDTNSSPSQGSDSTTPSPPVEADGQSAETSTNTADIVANTKSTGTQSEKEEKAVALNTGAIAGLSMVALIALGSAAFIAKRRSSREQLHEF